MIKDRRSLEKFVHIDFKAKETFEDYPSKNELTITLVTDGEWEFSINYQDYNLPAPFILCLNETDSFILKKQTNAAAKTFSFVPSFLNSSLTKEALQENSFENIEDMHDRNLVNIFLLRNNNYKGVLLLDAPAIMQINSWLSIICAECLSQSDGRWTCRIRRYLLQILYLLEEKFILCYEKKMSPKYPIDYALEYIHCNYNLGLTLEGISKYVGVNRTTLNENCKRKTGMTIIQYLNHYRITMAQEALKHTNLKLSEIAVCCGYNYESYFVKSFTEKQGISPNEYRKKYRG